MIRRRDFPLTGPKPKLSGRVTSFAPQADEVSPYLLGVNVKHLTELIVVKFCEMIAIGCPATTACDFIGISDTAFKTWIRLGEDVRSDLDVPDGALYLAFVLGLRRAGAIWVMERVRLAQQQGNLEWRRDLKILSIRDRGNWSYDAQGGADETFDANESYL